MRAAVRAGYGPPDVVSVHEVDKPVPLGDQVLVKVAAASVNRADLDVIYPRWGFLRLFLGLRSPRNKRLGIDAAGVVEAVGPNVARLKVDDRVYGDLFNFGADAFSEYVCPPEKALRVIPDEIPFDIAVTLPHSAILALQSLRLRNGRELGKDDRLLVVGASGNVGPFVVQMAKARGAEVTGVARTEKLDFVSSLGADHVIDYTKVDPRHTGELYDWIVDVDAHHSVFSWRHSLRPKGVYAALGGSASWFASLIVQMPATRLATNKKMGLMLAWKPFDPTDMTTLERLVADGTVKPAIDKRFPLDEVVDALRWLDTGRSKGKVLIEL